VEREIKFRAWDKVEKTMVDLEEITQLALCFPQYGVFIPFSDRWIIDQFTGLNDCTGKEIYEGDRVELVVIEDEIKRHKTATTAVVEWDFEDAGWFFSTDLDNYPHVKVWNAEKVKIIGNIHEVITE